MTVTTHRPHPATIAVFDALGRRVATLHQGALAAGVHVMPVDAVLPPGTYVVRLVGETSMSARFTVAR